MFITFVDISQTITFHAIAIMTWLTVTEYLWGKWQRICSVFVKRVKRQISQVE